MEIPDFDLSEGTIKALALAHLPVIKSFYESEKGQFEFKEWLKKQNDGGNPK